MNAEVVAVGSELLTPAHIDTNSLFITERLNELGIELQGKSVAADDRATLKAIVADALRRSDLLVLTGGLGPTDDDLTRDVVADLIGRPLEYHPEIFESIEKRFAARGLKTPEINRRQAMVPRGAVILPNRNGTAPGLWIEHGQKLMVLLPGPPRELKPMLESVIQERLAHTVGATRIFRRLLRVTGRSESYVEEQMQPGDLVAIVRTAGGNGALQQFTTDKTMLFAAIEHIRWYASGRGGVTASEPIEDSGVPNDPSANASSSAAVTPARSFRSTSSRSSGCSEA